MQLWRHLVDNREIIVTGSTYPWFISPRSPLCLNQECWPRSQEADSREFLVPFPKIPYLLLYDANSRNTNATKPIILCFQEEARADSYRHASKGADPEAKKKKKKKGEDMDSLKQELDLEDHKISVEELCKKYSTDINNVCNYTRAVSESLFADTAQKATLHQVG